MIPDRGIALHLYDGVFKPDILQHNVLFKKEPIRNSYPGLTSIKQCILLPVLNKQPLQVHIVEQGEINVPDLDRGI